MATDKPSKSARKREYLELQALGEALLLLTGEQLAGMNLDDDLLEAVLHAKTISSHGALRRQKQLIGKLMRLVDADPIRRALGKINAGMQSEKSVFRDAETWRDRVISGGSDALQEYFASIGRDNPELTATCRALDGVVGDRKQKELQRRIFREIHDDLSSNVQKRSN